MAITAKDIQQLGFKTLSLYGTTVDGVCNCKVGSDCGTSTGKHPKSTGWTTLPESENPKCGENLGARLGSVSENIIVVDVDVKKLKNGFAFLASMGFVLPETLTASTPSGGAHFFYRWPSEQLSLLPHMPRAIYKKLGVDLLGDNAYVAVEPSMIGEKQYLFEDFDAEIAAVPQWVIQTAEQAQELATQKRPVVPLGQYTEEETVRYASAASELNVRAPAIEGRGGHDSLFLAAQVCIRRYGLTDKQTMELLVNEYNPRCVPPWEGEELEREFSHKIKEAREKGKMCAKPISLPKELVQVSKLLEGSSDMDVADYWIKKMGLLKHAGGGLVYRYDQDKGIWQELSETECLGRIQSMRDLECLDKHGNPRKIIMTVPLRDKIYRAVLADLNVLDLSFLLDQKVGIAFKNGFLDENFNLLPHSPAHNAISCEDVDFDPGADYHEWDAYLESLFLGDEHMEPKKKILQEFAGICLIGKATIYQQCLVLEGSGSNGKSVFCKTLEATIFKNSHCSVPPQHWKDPLYVKRMVGKKINLVEEMPDAELSEACVFKAIIDGGTVSIREMYRKATEYRPKTGHIFATNNLPAVRDFSEGFWRRWIVVKFARFFKQGEIERAIEVRLSENVAGLFAWAIIGAQRALEQKGYTDLPSTETTLAEWRKTSDPVRDFVDCTCRPTDIDKETNRNLFDAFRNFCEKTNRKAASLPEFGRRLKGMGIEPYRTTKERGWKIYLLSESEWCI